MYAKALAKKDFTEAWGEYQAKQGVLLLNTALTVERGNAGSHTALWSGFTKDLIQVLMNHKDSITWIIMGTKAYDLISDYLDTDHNFIISSHPSPFSNNKTFKRGGVVYPSFNDQDIFSNVSEIKWCKNPLSGEKEI